MKTKEQKRERREMRWRLYKAVLDNHFKEFKFRATTAQLRAGARTVADRILAGQDPRIENSQGLVLSQTQEAAVGA